MRGCRYYPFTINLIFPFSVFVSFFISFVFFFNIVTRILIRTFFIVLPLFHWCRIRTCNLRIVFTFINQSDRHRFDTGVSLSSEMSHMWKKVIKSLWNINITTSNHGTTKIKHKTNSHTNVQHSKRFSYLILK